MTAHVIDLWQHPLGRERWSANVAALRAVRPTFGQRSLTWSPESKETMVRMVCDAQEMHRRGEELLARARALRDRLHERADGNSTHKR